MRKDKKKKNCFVWFRIRWFPDPKTARAKWKGGGEGRSAYEVVSGTLGADRAKCRQDGLAIGREHFYESTQD